MDSFPLISSFIASCLAGSLPTTGEVLSEKERTSLNERMERCYQQALTEWCADDAVRKRLAQKKFPNVYQLKDLYNKEEWDKERKALKDITALWIEEISKDEELVHHITALGIITIDKKTDKLTALLSQQERGKGQQISRGRKQHKAEEVYIRRYCSSERTENTFLYALTMRERHTLADYVTGVEGTLANKYVLYSSAQTGKTTELRQLCWELQHSGLYLPVSFEIRTNTKLKRGELPQSQFVDDKEVVVVIDALDEVNGQKYEDILEEIGGYAYEHPEMKMVLSCRSNYRREKQLELFTELFLEELSYNDACEYAEKLLGKNNGFMNCVYSNGLTDFIKNPFFLSVLVAAYKERGQRLPKTKAEIYRLFIERSYNVEKIEKNVPLTVSHSFEESVQLLERVALGLSLMNAQSLSREELCYCLQNKDDNVVECLRYNLIRCEDGQYSFIHNAFREWLVANYLNRVGLEKAKQLATHPNGRIKPEWYNIIMLWLTMYGKDRKAEVTDILGWLKNASLELVIYIDKNMVDDSTRNEVFKGLLMEYKSLGIRMSNIMTHDYEDLLSFGFSKETANYLADEISMATQGTAYYADLMCLCYFLDWDSLKADSEELTEKLFCVLLEKTTEALQGRKESCDLSFLYFDKPFFAQDAYFERLFDVVKESDHYEAVKAMIELISLAGKVDECIDYILEKERFVHDQQEGHTTRVVSRAVVYKTLGKANAVDSVRKILAHGFCRARYTYHIEGEEFLNMMKNALQRASKYITQGHAELIAIVEDFYKLVFKDYYGHIDNNEDALLLQALRDCYKAAGLRERGRQAFYGQRATIFASQEGGPPKYDDIRQLYLMAALWMTVDDVKADFSRFTASDGTDRAMASWYQEIPYADVAECADLLYKEKFPQPVGITKGKERRRQAFNDFADYDVFKQIVLEMVAGLDSHNSRKEHYKKLREKDEGFSRYAFDFLHLHTDDDDCYDVDEIVKDIKKKEVYEAFFMREVTKMMERPDPDLYITEEIKKRIVDCARTSVLKLCEGQTVYFRREAIGLMLKGEYEISVEKLTSLLPYGNYIISREDPDGYYHQEYSLFDYIKERVNESVLAPKVLENLRKNIGKEASCNLSYAFSNYIIEHNIEDGYGLALRFALAGYYMSANVMEELVTKGLMVEELKNASAGMDVSFLLSFYSTLVRNSQEELWVKEKLEYEYRNLSGYDLKRAVHILVGLGSMDALDYLVTNPHLITDGDDYHFNYDNPNAISALCYFIGYTQEHGLEGHYMLSSLLNSLERIAVKSEDSLAEVKLYLRQLTQKGENYKYLNRYIIAFEDKYYATYSGIGDIKLALQMVDGLRQEENDKVIEEDEPWGEDEGVYVSYNWEGHSAHIVDYLGFVLESRGIPFKYDRKDCGYTDNIKDFMDAIIKGKTVIIVLSRPYLKSKNCMYELSGILKDTAYKDRLLPVVVDDTIRDEKFYVELVRHWKEQKDRQTSIVSELQDIDADMAEPEEVKLKEIEIVYGFLKVIKDYIDWVNADNLDSISSSRFKKIVDEIYKRRTKK